MGALSRTYAAALRAVGAASLTMPRPPEDTGDPAAIAAYDAAVDAHLASDAVIAARETLRTAEDAIIATLLGDHAQPLTGRARHRLVSLGLATRL